MSHVPAVAPQESRDDLGCGALDVDGGLDVGALDVAAHWMLARWTSMAACRDPCSSAAMAPCTCHRPAGLPSHRALAAVLRTRRCATPCSARRGGPPGVVDRGGGGPATAAMATAQIQAFGAWR